MAGKVRSVSLRQLFAFVKEPSPAKAVASGKFLQLQLSARLEKTQQLLRSLPSGLTDSYGIRRLANSFNHNCEEIQALSPPERGEDCLEHAAALIKCVREIDTDAGSMCTSLRDDEKRLSLYASEVDGMARATFELLIAMRMYVSHYAYAVASTCTEEGHSEVLDTGKLGPRVGLHDVRHIVEAAVFDSQGFGVEKFGAVPDVAIQTELTDSITCICIDSHLHYVLMEVLKNAYRAMISQYGVLDIKDAPDVNVQITASDEEVGILVEDYAGGMLENTKRSALRFFHTTAPPMIATYTYSRQFGASFDGLGFGLPMSSLYCESMGGSLTIGVKPGKGCSVYVVANRQL